jgi:hypothetical protein
VEVKTGNTPKLRLPTWIDPMHNKTRTPLEFRSNELHVS